MKKLTAILLALVLLLSLTACGDVLSMLRPQPQADSPDTVQPQEPEIPNTPPTGGDVTAEPDDSTWTADPVEPTVPEPQPDDTPVGDTDTAAQPTGGVTASHSDVSLFSAGETFTMSVQGLNGVYASTFVSADPEIASVDEITGVITAVAPGMTTVTMHVECEAGQFDFDCIVRCRWSAGEPSLPDAGQPDVPDVSSGTSLTSFFSTLQGKYEGLGAMMTMDAQLLDTYYPGLSSIAAVEEVLIQETMMSTANVAVGLVKLSDSATTEDVLAVQSVLQGRITTQAEGGAFYPDSCETWENGVITSVSNCVGMFVYPDDAHSMASLFTDTFSN